MDYFEKKQWIRIAVCALVLIAAVLILTGVFNNKEPLTYSPADTEETGVSAEVLQAIALSMGNEKSNSYVTDYLAQDPYLASIYEGYGFAKDYGSARGHAYTLEDVQATGRPHAKANCLTCKTPDMHKMIAEQGVGVYSMPFEEVMAQTSNTVSCYTCHGDDEGNNGQMVITHQYVNEALGENTGELLAASLSCGQCHIEYYFTPDDSETMMPYHSKTEMTPEKILAYYDEMGFYDWEQPGTGTKMLKAQHPELETWAYGMHASMLSCADCHMPVKTTENGEEYHDHHLVSPLNSEALLNKCAQCHGSGEAIAARVREIQTQVTGRETDVGRKLAALKDTLTEAVSDGKMAEEELEAVRKLHREAQWFFDFCYVENSEGAHNSALANRCLNTSEQKISEAMALLAAAGYSDTKAAASETAGTESGEKVTPLFAGYRVEKKNNFSTVTVIATAEKGTLRSVRILSEGEEGMDLLTEEIKENWAKAILESGSAAPDAITGATLQFSAGSVTEAMTEILAKAAFTGTEEAPALETEKQEEEQAPAEAEAEPETTAEAPAEETAPAAGEESAPAETAAAEAGTKEETEQAEAAHSDAQVYAVYRAKKENAFSTITVTAAAKNGTLTEVKIQSEGEQDLLTDAVREEWAKAILESGSASPDAITGASLTFSAASVTEAMTEILGRIAGEETAETPAETPSETEEQTEAKEEAAPATQQEEAAASDEQVYAVYRAKKDNTFSTVTVIVTAKNGQMTSVKIQSEGEQDLLTDAVRDEWAKAILESGSAAPDAITGASLTYSAESVQAAVEEILSRMAGETSTPETPAGETEQEQAGEPAAETAETPAEEPAAEEAAAEQPAETAEAPAEETAAEEPAQEPAPKAIPAFAGYRADKKNSFSTVTVIVTARNGQMTSVKIRSEGEQDLLTDAIRAEWAKAILESGSASPDAITGASLTFSAASVQEAMEEILAMIAAE